MSRRSSRALSRRVLRTVDRRRRRLLGAVRRIRGRAVGDPRSMADGVVAERVRSTLGPVEKRLDVPRAHVMVADGTAVLHGVVAAPDDEVVLIRRAMSVPGVRTVDSRLHVGLGPGDGRPSAGRAGAGPSSRRRRLVGAAMRSAGVREDAAPAIAGAVLTVLAERIPPREREHLCAHLPDDVRDLTHHPRSPGAVHPRIRTVEELVDAVAEVMGLDASEPLERTRLVVATRAVVEELRAMVPEEAADVAAVLPARLRDLWTGAVVS